jgi:hypothetical protein
VNCPIKTTPHKVNTNIIIFHTSFLLIQVLLNTNSVYCTIHMMTTTHLKERSRTNVHIKYFVVRVQYNVVGPLKFIEMSSFPLN